MRFGLSEEQQLMCESLARTLQRHVPLDRVKAHARGEVADDSDIQAALGELALPALLVPDTHGGLGLGLLEAALVAELLGRSVVPTPFIGTSILAPLALRHAGSPAQQDKWLPRLAAGVTRIGLAVAEVLATPRDGAGVTLRDGRLYGNSLFVLDCAGAEAFIVADVQGGLHLVRADAAGLAVRSLPTIDVTRSLGELTFASVAAEPLCGGDAAAALVRMRDAAWVLLAADMLGAGQAMIEQAVSYSGQRVQFGRTIGTFQAVKHMCATAAAALEPCRALVWYAAHAQDEGFGDASLAAAHAKSHLGEVGRLVARTSVQVHGGIGVTDELGLHYWFKRIGTARQLYGGPEEVRRSAARMQGMLRTQDG